MFAVFLLPLTILTGGAVDLSNAIGQRTKVAAALDSAGLAAAKSMSADAAYLKSVAEAFLVANLGPTAFNRVTALNVTSEGARVILDGKVVVSTPFLAVAGISSISLPIHAEIERSTRKIELALALDNTGSMAGSKIAALRDAAEALVNGLYAANDADKNVQVALVPYVTGVNVRGDEFSWDWIDQAGASTWHGTNFEPRANHLDLFNETGIDWKGCVEMRASPYDVTDTAPNASIPDTLWTPYFWPDEPRKNGSGQDYHNDYIANDETYCAACAGLTGEALRIAQQRDVQKYADAPSIARDEVPSETTGPNKSCAQPITPLTNNKSRLVTEIRDMRPWNASGTNGAAGLAWAWRTLSPTPPYTQGASYAEKDVMKAIVMMTDGENTIYGGWNSHNKSNYSSYGYLSQERLGTSASGAAASAVNTKMSTLCDNIKAEGVTVFTVTFMLNSNSLKSVYRNCASKPEYYFDSTSSGALVSHFSQIAGELSELRVAR